ncbi:hypothetical protein QQS21_001642 [Conoideocrella luteorostrata]|uniref:WSC domain-containing protein n=1 Tax=Conoideocrella luteorostrata TaxID=1105319 RepID=A0AAJ0CXL4_9HYPO|nr:hypothetical protein QQS21_001642 [Conoideocrella luteorostrata]
MKFQPALFAVIAIASNFPMREFDPKTVKSCIAWYDNYMEDSCKNIRSYYSITPEEFTAWNPSVNLDCEPWWPVSYCILTREKWDDYNRTHPTATIAATTIIATSSAITSALQPSPTAWVDRGCYAEGASVTVMQQRMSPEGGDPRLSLPPCRDSCYRAGFPYAGFKNGNECWCSRYVAGEWAKNSAECNLPCSGDSRTICGGKDRINVYEAAYLGVTSAGKVQATNTMSNGA